MYCPERTQSPLGQPNYKWMDRNSYSKKTGAKVIERERSNEKISLLPSMVFYYKSLSLHKSAHCMQLSTQQDLNRISYHTSKSFSKTAIQE